MILWLARYVAWWIGLLLSGGVLYALMCIDHLDEMLHGFPRTTFLYMASTSVIAIWLLLWELLCPFEHYRVSRFQFRVDTEHLIQAAIVIGGLMPVVLWLPQIDVFGLSTLPVVLQFAILLLPQDLMLYWWHRNQHESGVQFLWHIHTPHHLPRRISLMTSARNHLIDEIALIVSIAVVHCLLAPSSEAIIWLIWYIATIGAMAHTNCDFRLGQLNWLIPGPEFHRVHHDLDPHEALNYSPSVPLWDLVFGTARPLAIGSARPYGIRGQDDDGP